MVSDFILQIIGRRIAGDIVWSGDPGASMRKWREIFRVSQLDVARAMMIASSVISDYEKGRRVPGSKFVRRFVKALFSIDSERGWETVKNLARSMNINIQAILDMQEFEEGLNLDELITVVNGFLLTSEYIDRRIYGYTVLDSIATIESMTGSEFYYIMGTTTERALIFTKVSTGRSPMVAVRVSLLKPAVVVIHGPRERVDPLAVRLAEKERIPLILSLHKRTEDLIKGLRRVIASKTVFSS